MAKTPEERKRLVLEAAQKRAEEQGKQWKDLSGDERKALKKEIRAERRAARQERQAAKAEGEDDG